MHTTLASRLIGFAASLLLTLAAFFIIIHPEFFHWGMQGTILAILTLAVLQFAVQSICFINLWSEKGPRWNLIVFISTISIILVIIIGSLWIMNHLNGNMM